MSKLEKVEARRMVILAALRCVQAEYSDPSEDPHFADEQDYSADMLDQAAVKLVEALNIESKPRAL